MADPPAPGRKPRRPDLAALHAVDPNGLYGTLEMSQVLGRSRDWAVMQARRLARDGRATLHGAAYLVPGRELLALAGGLLRLHTPPAPTETEAQRTARDKAAHDRLQELCRAGGKR